MNIERISLQDAARAFEACAGMDPEGKATPQSVALSGVCLRCVRDDGAAVVVSVTASADGVLWVHAAAGGDAGRSVCAELDQTLCRIARASGCWAVGFQTMRRGLLRRMQSLGYLVTDTIGPGWILKKAVQ